VEGSGQEQQTASGESEGASGQSGISAKQESVRVQVVVVVRMRVPDVAGGLGSELACMLQVGTLVRGMMNVNSGPLGNICTLLDQLLKVPVKQTCLRTTRE
jgi:hypothetical protein